MIEEEKFLDMESIAVLASENLPAHYRLGKVRLNNSSATSLPASLEIQIEFENHLDEALKGANEDIKTYQSWANPLVEKIRTQWPVEDIRISIAEKQAPCA